MDNHRARLTPDTSIKIIHLNLKGNYFKGSFDYLSIVGRMNLLEKGTKPEIAYAVHKCVRIS